jgi:hypothetical protein
MYSPISLEQGYWDLFDERRERSGHSFSPGGHSACPRSFSLKISRQVDMLLPFAAEQANKWQEQKNSSET